MYVTVKYDKKQILIISFHNLIREFSRVYAVLN